MLSILAVSAGFLGIAIKGGVFNCFKFLNTVVFKNFGNLGRRQKISRNSRRFSLFLSHFRAYCSPNLLGRIAIGMLPRNHISGYRIQFLHHGKLHDFTICKVDRDEAETKTRQVEYLIVRLKQRLIVLPEPEQSRQDTGPTCRKRK